MEMVIETAVLARLRRLPCSQKQETLNFVEFLEAKLWRLPRHNKPIIWLPLPRLY